MLARFHSDLSVVLHSAAASFPVPTGAGSEGGAITSWRDINGYSPVDGDISAYANKACTMTGPIGVFGVRSGKQYFISLLNNGGDIVFENALTGFSQAVSGVGTFERLIVGGVTFAGVAGTTIVPSLSGTVTFTATPLLIK